MDGTVTPSRWQRVKQRKIVQWALAYLAAAALVVGVASDLAQGFAWAVVVLRVLVAVLAVGILVVLVVAWYHGDQGQQRVTATEALLLAVLGIAAVAAGWIAAATTDRNRAAAEAGVTSGRIAVLPCDYAAGAAQLEVLSVGVAEQVITRLAQLPAVRPIALNSVLRYRGGAKDYPRIADALAIATILDCSISADTSVVRVTFHLIDARTQTELWAEPFVRSIDDLSGAGSDIAVQVARVLDAGFSDADQRRLAASPRANNQDAWYEYLRGLQLTTPMQADLQQAVQHFSTAIALDPGFAPAHAGLANALATMGEFGLVAPREARDTAKAAAQRALALDASLGEGYAARGWVEFWFDWDWAAAETDLKRALELQPSSAKAHFNYAYYLTAMQRHDAAIAHMKESVTLDPLNPFTHSYVAWAYFHAGRRAEAVDHLVGTIRRFPETEAAISIVLAWFQAAAGNIPEAIAAAQQAETAMQDDPWSRAVLGVVYARAGHRRQAERKLAELQSLRAARFIDPRNFAFVHAALGDTTRALDELEEAYRLGSPQLVFLRARDFLQDPLLPLPRYRALIDRMRFPRS